ncbi:MAG: GGDEF domain-containing protein [bacterium]|nr:GGDEF domain-containing protein [bacterium]
MKSKERIRGVRAWITFIPTIIVILILLMFLVVVTVLINKRSEKDANDAHKETECISLVSSLQTRSSASSEPISSFIYGPAIPTKFENKEIPPGSGNYERIPVEYKINNMPLSGYFATISNTETDPEKVFNEVTDLIRNNPILVKDEAQSDEILKQLDEVVQYMKYMASVQKQAIYVTSKLDYNGYVFPKEYLDTLGSYEFTEKEQALINDTSANRNDAIKEYALKLVFDEVYSKDKSYIADRINTVLAELREQSASIENHSDNIVWTLRRTLWVLVALIIIVLIGFFYLMSKKVIRPITKFAKDIQRNEMLDDEKGLYETNFLARSFNEMLDKKSDYEHRLTAVAETDPLTGFDNRYSYNKFLASKSDSSHSTCIFMLDINNLKYVNDTFGHDKGDELIKNSSLAIKETFMTYEKKNCYRLGGDEFIAILDNINEDEIEGYIKKFLEKQKLYDVSVAIGYAYTADISKVGYETLMIEADKRMYEHKKEMKAKKEEIF